MGIVRMKPKLADVLRVIDERTIIVKGIMALVCIHCVCCTSVSHASYCLFGPGVVINIHGDSCTDRPPVVAIILLMGHPLTDNSKY